MFKIILTFLVRKADHVLPVARLLNHSLIFNSSKNVNIYFQNKL